LYIGLLEQAIGLEDSTKSGFFCRELLGDTFQQDIGFKEEEFNV